MAISRWTPLSELSNLHGAMDRLFGDFFPSTAGEDDQAAWPARYLPVDIVETDEGYRLEASVPGFKPEEVDITFADGTLSLVAERRAERAAPSARYLRRELAWGNFRRQIALPADVVPEQIQAEFENGVLTVLIPRAAKPSPSASQSRPGLEQS